MTEMYNNVKKVNESFFSLILFFFAKLTFNINQPLSVIQTQLLYMLCDDCYIGVYGIVITSNLRTDCISLHICLLHMA